MSTHEQTKSSNNHINSNHNGELIQLTVPNYSESTSNFLDHIVAFLVGSLIGFVIVFLFYKLVILSIISGMIIGIVNINLSIKKQKEKRIQKLRIQFFDFLEALSVAMRAGNNLFKAIESAKKDLLLLYSETSDIIIEIEIIMRLFNNGIQLSQAFSHFAQRSGIEDIESFASIYATIEGKSSRADEIVRETQQIIADKMEIQMEIGTLMTASKTELNTMLIMPLIILGVIGYTAEGFMDAIYTTVVGRIVATGGFFIFIISYVLGQMFTKVRL